MLPVSRQQVPCQPSPAQGWQGDVAGIGVPRRKRTPSRSLVRMEQGKRNRPSPISWPLTREGAIHLARHGNAIGVCGSCLDARGIAAEVLIEEKHYRSMEAHTDWRQWADEVLVF
jgi:hypothetical protein